MLVQFALIAVALFGMAALTVDMGLARLTQAQMQTAADSAAIEGVRLRNRVGDDGFASDCTRRAAARDMVRRTFDDDQDLSTGGDSAGAGPVFEIVNGQGDADASAQVVVDAANHVYKPVLQLNQATNAVYGDMVSGTFTYTPSIPPDEAGDYLRADFVSTAMVPPGTSGLAGCPGDLTDPWTAEPSLTPALSDQAFLVRLRRTTDQDGLDNVPDESSSGPTIPWLFGRGTTIHSAPGPGRNIRQEGITVRATAIAATAPALAVGLPSGGAYGATLFYLTRAYYETLTNVPTPAPIQAGAIGPVGSPVGGFLEAPLTNVGEAVPSTSPTTCSESLAEIRGFVPLVEPIGASATPRVVGFGRIELLWDCMAPDTVQVSRGAQTVADANASAHLSGGLPADVLPEDVAELMAHNRTLYWDATGSPSHLGILTPALVR